MSGKIAVLLTAMLGLAIAAFIPPLVSPRRADEVPPIAIQQLEAEASRGSVIPPGVMQITDIRARGDYPYQVEGTVVYRSLFGVVVASARYYNSATVYEFAAIKLIAIAAVFLLLEGGLAFSLLKVRRYERER